jgi:hypothetical protein
MDSTPSWQSTFVGIAFIAAITGIFIVVVAKEGIDSGLKAWAAIGTLAGVVTGAVPTYFFGKAASTSAASAHAQLDDERKRRSEAELKVHTLFTIDPELRAKAQAQRADLFR